MEGVEGLLKNMRLSEVEKKGVKVGGVLKGRTQAAELQAVGKLMSERPVAAEYLKRALGGIWCPMHGTIVKELGDNRFRFIFSQASGKSKALKEGPWMFNHELLVVVEFDPRKSLDEHQFTRVPCWIRVMKLPFGLMNRDTAESIGEEFGGLLDAETDEDGSAVGKFLRIKVTLDIREPLRRGIKIIVEAENDEDGSEDRERWCPFQYEFLPDFCYCCGRLGHKKDYCQMGGKKTNVLEYGPELMARKFGEERGRSSPGVFGGSWGGAGSGSKSGSRSDGASWKKEKAGSGPATKQNKGDGEEVTSPMKGGKTNNAIEGKNLGKELALITIEVGKEGETGAAMEVEIAKENHLDVVAGEKAEENTMEVLTTEAGEESNVEKLGTHQSKFKRIPRTRNTPVEVGRGKSGAKRALDLEDIEEGMEGKKAKTNQEEREIDSSSDAQKLAGLPSQSCSAQ